MSWQGGTGSPATSKRNYTMATNTTRKTAAPKSTSKAKADAPVTQTPAIHVARENVASKAPSGVGVTLHTTGQPIKGLAAQPQKAKPQRKMLRVIDKIKGHPGKGNCIKRFHLYKEGMTLLHCKVTEGLIPSDVTFYAELGYLTLREPTDAEYDAAVAEWEKANGKTEEQAAQAS